MIAVISSVFQLSSVNLEKVNHEYQSSFTMNCVTDQYDRHFTNERLLTRTTQTLFGAGGEPGSGHTPPKNFSGEHSRAATLPTSG